MATNEPVELTTVNEYDAIEHQVMEARDALERFAYNLSRVSEEHPPTRLVTFEDIGARWSLCDGLQALAGDMLRDVDRLRGAMCELDQCRLEGWVATDEAA